MNPSDVVYLFAAAALFGLGAYGVLISGHVMRKLLSLNVIASSVFLMLVTLGSRGMEGADPVPQAMVLTGIVVAVSATGFALALLLALYRRTGSAELDGVSGDDDDA